MCCGHQRKERCSWQRSAPTARAASANAQTGVGRGATPQATAASKSWRIPQGSPSSLWEGVSKFHYPPRCHRARFAESGLRLRRSLSRFQYQSQAQRSGLGLERRSSVVSELSALAGSEGYGACFNDVVAAHLMPLSRGFCACIMVYSVFNVQRKASWRMSLHLSSFLGHFCKAFSVFLRDIF